MNVYGKVVVGIYIPAPHIEWLKVLSINQYKEFFKPYKDAIKELAGEHSHKIEFCTLFDTLVPEILEPRLNKIDIVFVLRLSAEQRRKIINVTKSYKGYSRSTASTAMSANDIQLISDRIDCPVYSIYRRISNDEVYVYSYRKAVESRHGGYYNQYFGALATPAVKSNLKALVDNKDKVEIGPGILPTIVDTSTTTLLKTQNLTTSDDSSCFSVEEELYDQLYDKTLEEWRQKCLGGLYFNKPKDTFPDISTYNPLE